MNKIKSYLLQKLGGDVEHRNLVAQLQAEIAILKSRLAQKEEVKPLTPAELTMRQLGSYLPNFKGLENKPQAFKLAVGKMCSDLSMLDGWQYLITNLKQDQVNTYLFTNEEKKSEEFMRGSINGIYIVEEQIRLLGSGYTQYVEKNTKVA